jgi:hypothetical protein
VAVARAPSVAAAASTFSNRSWAMPRSMPEATLTTPLAYLSP